MRRFLLVVMAVLVLTAVGIGVYALVSDNQKAMILVALPALPFLPILLVYLLLSASAANRERHQGMADAAEKRGLQYTPDATRQLLAEMAAFTLIDDQASLSDVIHGEQDGVPLVAFLSATTYLTGNSVRYRYATVSLLPLESARIPDFVLVPANLWDRIPSSIEFPPVEFTGSAQRDSFSKQFKLSRRDEAGHNNQADFMSDSLMEWMTSHPPVSVEVRQGRLLVSHEASLSDGLQNASRSIRDNVADEAESTLQHALKIRNLLLG